MSLLSELPLEKNHPMAGLVYAFGFEIRLNKKKEQYLQFKIADKSATLACKRWPSRNSDEPSAEEFIERFKDQKVLFVTGKVDTYGDVVSITADSIAVPEIEAVKEFMKDNPEPAPADLKSPKSEKKKRQVILPSDLNDALKSQAPLKSFRESDKNIEHILRIVSLDVRDGNKGPFAQFKLCDATAEFDGKLWDINDKDTFLAAFKDAKAVYVVGETNLFRDNLQIIVDDMSKVELSEEVLNSLYVSTTYDVRFLKRGVWKMLKAMKNEWIRKLCEAFYVDKEFNERFSLVPAGVSRHHSTRNGLLEHTYRLMTLAADFVDSYNKHTWPENRVLLDKDLVVAACFLHDSYKSFEYNIDGTYADEGNMLGHISRCIMEIGSKTALISNFPKEIKELLAHCVSSHHGEIKFGSPDTPCCPEAIVCHYFDNMCSKLDPTILELNNLLDNRKWTSKPVKALGEEGKRGKLAHLGNSLVLDKPVITHEEQVKQSDEQDRKSLERKKLQGILNAN